MNTEKMREEFEQWYADNFGGLSGVFRNLRVGNEYPQESMESVNIAWKAWQAARAGGDGEDYIERLRQTLQLVMDQYVPSYVKKGEVSGLVANAKKLLLETAPPPPAAKVPVAWKLVPIEPTQEMLLAGEESYTPTHTGTPVATPSEVYTAMLYAAPQPAEQPPDVTLLLELLSHARCNTCDGSGGLYDNHGHPHQCPWCHDRSTALAAYRKGGEV